jgi:NADP-dependent 3-hydroxy acid dehydrogenase YdfG
MALKDQVVIITGASSGIGTAVARNLNEAGMKLVITARRADRLQQLSKELRDTIVLAGDMLDPAMPTKLIEKAVSAFGRCDVVFNNAGVIEVGTIETVDVERICQMVRINVEAAFRMAYVALKYFRSAGAGHLVNTSSILGTKVRPTAGAYAGTKFAIEALSEALRMEVAKTNIKVSCIEPGLVLTELHDQWETHPMEFLNIKKPLLPEDVARGVRFLLEQPDHVRIPKMLVLPGEHEI